MKRLLAVAGAGAMIAAAFIVRDRIDDDGSGDGGRPGDAVHVLCATELRGACDALAAADDTVEVTVEDAAETLSRLGVGDGAGDGVDGWLTFAPWPEMANIVAGGTVFREGAAPVVSTDIVLLFPEGPNSCLSDQSWRCLGTAPTPYRVGMPPPETALGAVLYGAATTGYFGRADIGTNEIELDDSFGTWSRHLLANLDDDPLGELLRVYPPTLVYDAVPVLDVDVTTRVLPSRAAQLLIASEPTPAVRVDVVLAPVGASAHADRLDELAHADRFVGALTPSGWQEGGAGPGGLPSAGVLVSLSHLQ